MFMIKKPSPYLIPGTVDYDFMPERTPSQCYVDILIKIADYYNVSLSSIRSRKRSINLIYARQIFYYFMKKTYGKKVSNAWLSEAVHSTNDHSSVVKSLRKFQDLMDTDQLIPKSLNRQDTIKDDYYIISKLLKSCLLESLDE